MQIAQALSIIAALGGLLFPTHTIYFAVISIISALISIPSAPLRLLFLALAVPYFTCDLPDYTAALVAFSALPWTKGRLQKALLAAVGVNGGALLVGLWWPSALLVSCAVLCVACGLVKAKTGAQFSQRRTVNASASHAEQERDGVLARPYAGTS